MHFEGETRLPEKPAAAFAQSASPIAISSPVDGEKPGYPADLPRSSYAQVAFARGDRVLGEPCAARIPTPVRLGWRGRAWPDERAARIAAPRGTRAMPPLVRRLHPGGRDQPAPGAASASFGASQDVHPEAPRAEP